MSVPPCWKNPEDDRGCGSGVALQLRAGQAQADARLARLEGLVEKLTLSNSVWFPVSLWMWVPFEKIFSHLGDTTPIPELTYFNMFYITT